MTTPTADENDARTQYLHGDQTGRPLTCKSCGATAHPIVWHGDGKQTFQVDHDSACATNDVLATNTRRTTAVEEEVSL